MVQDHVLYINKVVAEVGGLAGGTVRPGEGKGQEEIGVK